MKQFLFFLSLLIMVANLNAQYTYNDFDANQNEPFLGWPNTPVVIANPDPSGINTSAGVAQWDRSGEQWAHVYCLLDGKIDFSTGTVFMLKAWSPIACQVLFKLEDKTNSGIFTEISANITTPNTWVQLSYNFSSGQSGLYDKIVVFFDFATTTPNTFYFDDVTGPEYAGAVPPKPYLALDVQDNFENNGWGTIEEWFFQDPNLVPLTITTDPVNASNHVADYNRSGSFQYTNAQFILDHRMDLHQRNLFEMKVFFPSSNNYTGSLTPTTAIKLQNSLLGPNAWTTQTERLVNVSAFDQWVTLSFDFAAVADCTIYDQVVIQLGGEGHWEPGQFYFDDLQLMGASGNGTLTFTPANGSTNVEITVSPSLSFSVPVTMANGDAISNSDIAGIVTFRESDAGGPLVPFTGTINAEKTIITIDPVDDLLFGQVYYLALNNEVIRYENADLIPGQNVTFTTENDQKPYLALDVQDNFENSGWGTIEEWFFQDPNLVPLSIVTDPVNPSNHVADYQRSGSFEWTNAQFILNHRMDLHQRNEFELKVYFPSTNNYTGSLTPTTSVKLQNSLLGPNAWTTQTEVIQTVQNFDQWVTLTFNFSQAADSMNYDQVVVQLGGEGHFEPAQFYFDDIELMGASGNGTLTFFPSNGANNIEITINPTLSFSVPVTMANGNAISNSDIAAIVTFRESDAGGPLVPFNGTINAEKTVITINPVDDLSYGQTYYVALNHEVIRYQNADLIAGQSITFTTENNTVKPYLALDVQDNFENNGWGTIGEWLFQDPEFVPLTIVTDPLNPSNHVADYNRSGNFEWTNAQFVLNHRMDLHQRNMFELEVYFPSTNNYTGSLTPTASIKLQNSLLGPNAWTTQTEVKETVQTFDQWVTITFDFSQAADSMNYDQVVVQLGGEGHWETAQFYFDDIRLLDTSISVQEKPKDLLTVYPNPVSDVLQISSAQNLSYIEIYNATGQQMVRIQQIPEQIPVGYLPAGIYTLIAYTFHGEYFITKVLVSK